MSRRRTGQRMQCGGASAACGVERGGSLSGSPTLTRRGDSTCSFEPLVVAAHTEDGRRQKRTRDESLTALAGTASKGNQAAAILDRGRTVAGVPGRLRPCMCRNRRRVPSNMPPATRCGSSGKACLGQVRLRPRRDAVPVRCRASQRRGKPSHPSRWRIQDEKVHSCRGRARSCYGIRRHIGCTGCCADWCARIRRQGSARPPMEVE